MKKIITLCLAVTLLSGCASIIKGKNQNINVVTSNGRAVNATVYSKSGTQEVQLPRLISVQKDSQDITITVKEGRCNKESVTVVNSHVEPVFWGNIIIGGIFGSTTDSATGSMWKYDENVMVNVNEKQNCYNY